ncbi:O-antigen ligase [Salinibacter ruber]|uniref:O-antigen ligase family protein n=1 Tax=Salinibacter ruber TaxID=146919 RepID=UPI0013C2E471|nr:O-antigen ligase family protein [Salinibacter ruber]MCS3705883.1 O-antigen ligase [Salinibacter ruber]
MNKKLGSTYIGKYLSVALFSLATVGYPYAIILATLLGTNTSVTTIPYRALVTGMGVLVVLLGGIRIVRLNKKPVSFAALLLFLVMSLKIITLYMAGIVGNKPILIWFFATLIPSISFSSNYMHKNIQKCVKVFLYLLFPAVLGVLAIWVFDIGRPGRGGQYAMSTWGLNSNLLGDYTLYGFALSIYIWLSPTYRGVMNSNYLTFVMVLFFAVTTFMTLSSGAVLSLLIILVIIPFATKTYFAKYVVTISLIVTIVISTIYFYYFTVSSTLQTALTVLDISGKIDLRLSMLDSAWSQFLSNPLTGGTGLVRHPMLGTETYPHNVVIESFAKLGLFGGVVFSSVFAIASYRALSYTNSLKSIAPVALLFLVSFTSKLFSGGIYLTPMLYYFLVFVITYNN